MNSSDAFGWITRLTRAEYWLLKTVIEFRLGLHAFVRPDLDQQLNKPPHGLSAERLAGVLTDLFARGWVEAGEAGNDTPTSLLDRAGVAESLAFAGDLTVPGGHWYGLTAAGGALWEAFAAPDWGRYLAVASDPTEGVGELVAADDCWPRQYFALLHHLGEWVIPGSERWDAVRPWQAVYWKVLPVGQRARYRFTPDDPPTDWTAVPEAAGRRTRWWCRWR